jgi:hypothetical protein
MTGRRPWGILVGGVVLLVAAIVAGIAANSPGLPTAVVILPSATVSAQPPLSATTSAPAIDPTASPTTPTTTTSRAAASGTAIRAYITGYSYFDNTPPGSAAVSNPVLHKQAGGTGAYADPITVAVGHVITGGKDVLDWKAGTRFYVPNIRRYLIVEDTCGDGPTPQDGPCHTGYPRSASTWLDVWAGGEGGSRSGANSCLNQITGVWDVIVNPSASYAVTPGSVYSSGGCTQQYGNELVSA